MSLKRFGSRPLQAPLALGLFVAGALALALPSCGGSADIGTLDPAGTAGTSAQGTAGTTGNAGTSGGAGTTGSAGATGAGNSTGTGTAGAQGTAGATGAAGSSLPTGSAGITGNAGTTGAAGATGNAGRGGGSAGTTAAAGRGGTTGSAGSTGAAGTTGAAGRGGTTGTAGTTGTGGSVPPTCSVAVGARCPGAQAQNPYPFGCNFAWGRQNPSGTGSLSSYNYLQSVAYWVESGIKADGTYSSCGGCSWLSSRVSGTNLIPVYYAYMIGYYGHMNGLPDQNTSPNSANLATGGAALIKANRAKIITMYANYARDTYAVWKTKPLVWFLEGDFIQYTETSQGSPLTMAELGQLAADITCAIKSNMPNAVVAINHTTWNGDDETNNFWCEMKRADYDLVWTTGVGNNGNFIEAAGKAGYYNAATATYPYVHTLTGKTIAVDTSYGASAMSDSWSNQPAATLMNHISNGVIGINISSNPPSNYQSLISGLGTLRLPSSCQ